MLLKNLTKVWVSEYEEVNEHGEKGKRWKYKGKILTVREVNSAQIKELNKIKVKNLSADNNGIAYLNLQQDLNELDRNSSGEVDYTIENARTDINYDIQKGNGISLTDISNIDNFVPDYLVTDCPKIGRSTLYKLEKYNGN